MALWSVKSSAATGINRVNRSAILVAMDTVTSTMLTRLIYPEHGCFLWQEHRAQNYTCVVRIKHASALVKHETMTAQFKSCAIYEREYGAPKAQARTSLIFSLQHLILRTSDDR